MSSEIPPVEAPSRSIATDRIRFGFTLSVFGLLMLILGAKPDWFGLDRNPTVVGFAQIAVIMIGLAFLCVGGYIGLAAMWGGEEKSIVADIGSRLVSTGYVIALFSGMADVFGMSVHQTDKKPFFGPWQQAGVQIGMVIILAGILMVIPYRHLTRKK